MKIKFKKNSMTLLKEKYFKEFLKSQYAHEQCEITKTKESLNSFLKKYREIYPFHYLSYRNLKHFLQELSKLELLPSEEEYMEIHNINEFFDIELMFFINADPPIQVQFQYPLNVHKVTSLIKETNISKVTFDISDLENIIRTPCFDEFDSDMKAKKEGIDYLESIKAQNPIIVLNGGNIVDTFLINGNHRVIQAIRDNKKTIDGYLVTESVVEYCGITKDYQKLYSLMRGIPVKIYGGKYIHEFYTEGC